VCVCVCGFVCVRVVTQGRLTSHSMIDLSLLSAVQAHDSEILGVSPCYRYIATTSSVFIRGIRMSVCFVLGGFERPLCVHLCVCIL
jgi:hypothetical protein